MSGDSQIRGWPWREILCFSGIAAILFAIILTGPQNLVEGNEDRMAGFVQDAAYNGNWICSRDERGGLPSKPPLSAWIAAAATVLSDTINPVTLYFPSALSALLLACVLFVAGKKYFSYRAGIFAGLTFLFCHSIVKPMGGCRHDTLFALGVTLAALAAFDAWQKGRGWVWFWLASAMATMTKGPFGILLAAAGLLAFFWEKNRPERPRLRGNHGKGIGLFFLITGGWFVLACWKTNGELFHRMIVQELFTHAVTSDRGDSVGSGFYKPTLTFLGGFAPWSLFVILALWRIWKTPSVEPAQRRFERFLFCWFFVGLIIFSVAAHQRGRLIIPLIPIGALLAGRELARFTKNFSRANFSQVCAAFIVLGLATMAVYFHIGLRKSKGVLQTDALRSLAAKVRSESSGHLVITHVDSPFAFQFYLKQLTALTPIDVAAPLMEQSSSVFLAINPARLKKLPLLDKKVYPLTDWTAKGEQLLQIISNRPALQSKGGVALGIGSLVVQMENVTLEEVRGNDFVFSQTNGDGSIRFVNESNRTEKMRVRWREENIERVHRLMPGETWLLENDAK